MTKPRCSKDSAHGVIMVRDQNDGRQNWHCIQCHATIEPVADDHSFKLSHRLLVLADELEHGETKVTHFSERCDSTVRVTHVTYGVDSGRVEVTFHDPDTSKDKGT